MRYLIVLALFLGQQVLAADFTISVQSSGGVSGEQINYYWVPTGEKVGVFYGTMGPDTSDVILKTTSGKLLATGNPKTALYLGSSCSGSLYVKQNNLKELATDVMFYAYKDNSLNINELYVLKDADATFLPSSGAFSFRDNGACVSSDMINDFGEIQPVRKITPIARPSGMPDISATNGMYSDGAARWKKKSE